MDFATPDAKTVAITLSENPLDGRRLLIKDGELLTRSGNNAVFYNNAAGGDFTGRPSTSTQTDGDNEAKEKLTGHSKTAQKILASQKQPAGPTLFFGNLGFETTEQSIREMLNAHRSKPSVATNNAEEAEATGERKGGWIRKIRLGTFEDSGKCKGYSFPHFPART